MSTGNIHYKTNGIVNFFDGHRDKWEDFYPSEKWAFEKLAAAEGGFGKILDAGCAVGGLGLTLTEEFDVKAYTGVDINALAIEKARSRQQQFSVPVQFECGDILTLDKFDEQLFDTVFSLSCADWNIDTDRIISRCWEFVKPGGNFVISLRLTPGEGVNDIAKSYQPICCDAEGNAVETANYVVFNYADFFRLVEDLEPKVAKLSGYGYWGNPASNATTPYTDLVFAVFILTKGNEGEAVDKIKSELLLPLDLFTNK